MSNLQESLLNSFEILAKNYVQQAPGTTVIEGVIQQIVNAGTGHYIINYLDNLMEVHSNNPNIQFNLGDKVFVLVPNGDFSKQKIIISMSTPSTMIYDSSEEDRYMEVSDNLFNNIEDIELSTYKTEIIDMNTNDKYKKWYGNFSILFPKYLKNYSTFLFSASIKTSIKTEQQINGNYGIKLKLPFYFYNSEKEKIPTWKTYTLDVNNISGNPYRLTEWSKQNIFIQMSSEELYDDNREPQLEIFVKDFAQNEELAKEIKDIKIKNIVFHAYDILSEDQQQGYYLHLKATEGNYFFSGEEEETKILIPTLKANGRNVKLNTTHTSVEDSYQCYWFVEDAAIKEDSELYTYIGGIGWRCLNNKTNTIANDDGSVSVEFATNNYTYEVRAKNVLTSARYKCVIVVIKQVGNGKTYSTTVSTILKLENLKASINMSVDSITGSNSYIKNIGKVGLKCTIIDEEKDFFNIYPDYSITYEWNRHDKNNKYLDNDFYIIEANEDIKNDKEHIISQQISLNTNLIEDTNIFTCSAYISYINQTSGLYKKILLGTESILINTNGSFAYNLSIQNGDVLYKYDIDGDSPLSEKYDGPLDSKVAIVKPLTYTIYKADGTEFSDSEYAYCKTTWLIPKNSLITFSGEKTEYDNDYYQFSGVGRFEFNYTLASKYNFKKTNNVIKLKVNYGENELNADAAIKVLKEGENGTNNTNYSIVITHNGAAYNEIKNGIVQKFQAIYVENDKWYYHNLESNTLEDFVNSTLGHKQLKLHLYESGEEIEINEDTVSIEWTMFDPEVTETCMKFTKGGKPADTQIKGINCWIGPEAIEDFTWKDGNFPVNIVQVKVNIEGKTELYAYYPIEIIKVDNLDYIKRTDIDGNDFYIIPTCIGGFSSVLYSSDGTNPQYNSSEPFTCVDSISSDIDFENTYEYEWQSSENLIKNAKTDDSLTNQASFRPIAKYDSSITKNYIVAILTLNNKVGEEIENEITNQKDIYNNNNTAKDSLEEEKVNISNFLRKSNKIIKDIYTLLELSKSFLQAKAKVLNDLEELSKKYKDFTSYYRSLNLTENTIDQQLYTNYDEHIHYLFEDIRANQDIFEENLIIRKIDLKKKDIVNLVKEHYQPKEGEEVNYTSLGAMLYNVIESYNEQFSIFLKSYNSYCSYNTISQNKNSESKNNFLLLIDSFIEIINLIEVKEEEESSLDIEIYLSLLKKQLNGLLIKFNINSEDCAITYLDVKNILDEAFKLISYYGTEDGTLSEVVKKELKDREKLYAETAETALKEYTKLQAYLSEHKEVITYIRPIVMTYNRYSLSAIAGWDGNRLYTGTGNTGDYLYAPQVGAGVKETDGSFTGIVIGHKKESDKSKIGLFGFNRGVESIFLNSQNGSAIFGVSGEGQITIVPGGTSSIAGWQINQNSLSKEDKQIGTVKLVSDPNATIKIDDVNRHVAFQAGKGNNQAIITYDGWFKSNYGSIGGWTINSSTLTGGNLILDKNGNIYSNNHNSLDSENNGFYLSDKGLSIGDKFKVESNGIITAKELYASNEGKIGGWNIGGNQLYSDSIELNSNGSIKHKGNNWEISSTGYATFKYVNITTESPDYQSTIGSINILSNGLQSTNWSGSSIGSGFQILNSGAATFDDINARGGSIGGCKITDGVLKIENANISSLSVDKITDGEKDGYRIEWRAIRYVSDIETRSVGIMRADGDTETVQVVKSYTKDFIYVLCGRGGTA